MADQYKLTYFNGKGAAETIRYIFALAGVEYEDHRLEKEDWPTVKPSTKWGQVPVLEVNGVQMAQSVAIGRYLARKYKLAGENPMEEFSADEIIDSFSDLRPQMRQIYMEQDEGKKAELKKNFLENSVKPFLTKLSALKEKNGGKWMVGKNITWADIHLAHGFEYITMLYSTILSSFPSILQLQKSVFELPNIKKWIETRPKTDM